MYLLCHIYDIPIYPYMGCVNQRLCDNDRYLFRHSNKIIFLRV